MNILVGTLYCGENEFKECCESIKAQSHTTIEHFVVRDLPNKLAHETLYQTFIKRADEFDLFVKIDADMVLEDVHFFKKLIDLFTQHPNKRGVILELHDFFTDRRIIGLHAYRSSAVWKVKDDTLFVDPNPIPVDEYIQEKSELEPAAIHCKNPSLFQAFHFGVHKGLKVREAQSERIVCALQRHAENIEYTWQHFLKAQDLRLGLASLGAEYALIGKFSAEHLDYSNPFLNQYFMSIKNKNDVGSLTRKVSHLRILNLGFMNRAEIWQDGWMRYVARCLVPRALKSPISKLIRPRGLNHK